MLDSETDEILQAEELIKENKMDEALVLFRRIEVKAWTDYNKGYYKKALHSALKCKDLYEKIGNKIFIAENLILIGYSYIFTGDNNTGLIYGQKSLKLYEELENQEGIANSLSLIGVVYNYKGKLDQAIEFFEKSLSIEEINPRQKVGLLYNLGNVIYWKGEIDKSLKYCESALELVEDMDVDMGMDKNIALILLQIGNIYHVKGDYKKAVEYDRRALVISESKGLIFPLGLILECLILVLRNSNAPLEEAKKYVDRLQELAEQNPKNKTLNHQYLLGRAGILLTYSSRTQDRAEAELLLKQIVKDKISNPPTHIYAILTLCEYLIEELKISNDSRVLDEINPLIDRLLYIAEKTNSYLYQVQAKIIQSKLALIQMNFKEAKTILAQAQKIAESHDLYGIAQQISSEHDHILEQKEMWEQLKKIKAPMEERVNLASFDRIIAQMQGRRALEPPELVEEEPILLLIMDKSGISYFNYPFSKDWDYNWLFSSFMSAFETFSSEIFSESIDRIKIGENIILINPIESFLVCYVIKGQSYLGLQKLNRFSDAIKDNKEIWETLNRAVQTGEELDLENQPSLKLVVDEIFR